jgi:ketosteroid isomerase-like protein
VNPAEVLRESWRAWSEGDLDRAMRFIDPDVVVIAPEGWPEGAVTRGAEAWELQARRLRESWEEAWVEVDEIRELEGGRVSAQIRYATRGKEGIEFSTPLSVVAEIAGEKIKHIRYDWPE